MCVHQDFVWILWLFECVCLCALYELMPGVEAVGQIVVVICYNFRMVREIYLAAFVFQGNECNTMYAKCTCTM